MSPMMSPPSPSYSSASSMDSPRSPWGHLSVQMDSPSTPMSNASTLADNPNTTVEIFQLDEPEQISQLVDEIVDATRDSTTLYIDVKQGEPWFSAYQIDRISVLQIHIEGSNRVYQISVESFCHDLLCDCEDTSAFAIKGNSARGSAASCLKDIVESKTIEKIFYDVRYAACVLSKTYSVDLQNSYDLQFLDFAFHNKQGPSGDVDLQTLIERFDRQGDLGPDSFGKLVECIKEHCGLEGEERAVFERFETEIKDIVERGANYSLPDRLTQREIQQMYAIDVQFLPRLESALHEEYYADEWLDCVEELSKIRIQRAQQLDVAVIFNRPHLEALTL